mgnify:CR=1 FL=1
MSELRKEKLLMLGLPFAPKYDYILEIDMKEESVERMLKNC